MATSNAPNKLYEDFEAAFHACFVPIVAHTNHQIPDIDEIKLSSELNIQRFLDLAKQVECYFLNKRYILATQRPDQAIIEENYDLRAELQRKEQILQKYNNKIAEWQQILNEKRPPGAGGPPGGPGGPLPPPHQGGPQLPPPPPHMGGPPGAGGPGPGGMLGRPGGFPGGQTFPGGPGMMRPGLMSPGGGGPHMGGGPPMGPMGSPSGGPPPPSMMGSGPLAFLERTTSNIGSGR